MTEAAPAEGLPLRRASELTSVRRPSEVSRRESLASTTVSSSDTQRRRSSVMVTPGEWKPSVDRDAASNAGSPASSRRSSAVSATSSARAQSLDGDGAEITFGNGETTSIEPIRKSSSATALSARRASGTSQSVSPPVSPTTRRPSEISLGQPAARRPSDSSRTSESSPLVRRASDIARDAAGASPGLVRRNSGGVATSPGTLVRQSSDTPKDASSPAPALVRRTSGGLDTPAEPAAVERQISNEVPVSTGASQALGSGGAELPPLPPLSAAKRFSNLLASKPKVASKLRSLIKRSSSDREHPSGEEEPSTEGGGDQATQSAQQAPSLSPITESSHHYNEYEQGEQPMSPGRARIYTVEQAVRRGSFLPINRIKSEAGGLGPRRTSIRLSEADVGLLLGKVSKISADTLRQAALEGNTTLCEALIRGAVPIDETDVNGRSALMLAAEHGKGDTTEHLLGLGATVEIKDDNGMTALFLAVNGTKVSCVKALMAWGADCNLVVNGDSMITLALMKVESSLVIQDEAERKTMYENTSEVSRVLVKESKGTLSVRREKLRKPTLFLLDEWVRAKAAGEELVVPPMEKLMEGEKTLINFLKQHRQRVNVIATIKIWFVISFIGFDLATREMTMTPARILTYVVLYVGAYYL